MRQALGKGMFVGARWSAADGHHPRRALPGGSWKFHRDAEGPWSSGTRDYPAPDGTLTFDKLSSVFLSGNSSRDDQPNHIRVAAVRAARGRRGVGRDVPGRGLRDRRRRRRAGGRLKLSPSNCVQCGAITARGGRLTPPEGGSGPEYTLT